MQPVERNGYLEPTDFEVYRIKLHKFAIKVTLLPIVATTILSYSRPFFLNCFSYFVIGTIKAIFTPRYHYYTWAYYHFSANAYRLPLLWKISKLSFVIGLSMNLFSEGLRLIHPMKLYFPQSGATLENSMVKVGKLMDRLMDTFSSCGIQIIQKVTNAFEIFVKLFHRNESLPQPQPQPQSQPKIITIEPSCISDIEIISKAQSLYKAGNIMQSTTELDKVNDRSKRDAAFGDMAVYLALHKLNDQRNLETALYIVDLQIENSTKKELVLVRIAEGVSELGLVQETEKVLSRLQQLTKKPLPIQWSNYRIKAEMRAKALGLT